MMVAIFGTLVLAIVLGQFGPRWAALGSLFVCLCLFVWLFLFEIYSPEYGFRMPWLQTGPGLAPLLWG